VLWVSSGYGGKPDGAQEGELKQKNDADPEALAVVPSGTQHNVAIRTHGGLPRTEL
jgi:hypothetical protein